MSRRIKSGLSSSAFLTASSPSPTSQMICKLRLLLYDLLKPHVTKLHYALDSQCLTSCLELGSRR
jgi:hypothetical protein